MRPHLATFVEDFRRHGKQTAIVTYRGNRRTSTSYSELADAASGFAAELMRRGIGLGDRVVLWGQNGPEWAGCFFGCIMRGVIAVPLDAAGSLDFAKRVIRETQPKLIVGDAALLGPLDAASATLPYEELAGLLSTAAQSPAVEPTLNLDTPLQILFTSGTTAEPKGIVHTHRNVLASVTPIEREIQKYLRYERFVHPLRFLHTLPLSHVFGQFMGLWVPPLLAAEVHYESRLQAQRLMETARRERISVLAAVPRVLELLRDALNIDYPELEIEIDAAAGEKVWKRWWRFRRVHRALGFKFWAFVCGGASLPAELESFWSTLGFALIQGYGMTETAALITLNHPFKRGKGTIGKVLPGREVEIREDGEILVRGDMVSTATWRNGAMQQNESPWLATGDLATRDEQGQLRFVGRKSQVIVNSSGLNIHPEDVEAALNAQSGVEASAVVPLAASGGDEPFAVLLFRGSREAAQKAVITANERLADYQRIRQWRVWPELDLPRTSTGKIQRRKVAEWVNAQQAAGGSVVEVSDPLLALILSITGASADGLAEDPRLGEDLHLDSLGRVQLQAELEQRMGLTLSDAMLEKVSTLGQLKSTLGMSEASAAMPAQAAKPVQQAVAGDEIYPKWTWSWPSQAARVAFTEMILRPLVWLLANPRVESELAQPPSQPLLIVANHVSTYDLPLILYALPAKMRRHVAAAMAANMLADWRHSRNQGSGILNLLGPLTYLVVTGVFNVFPLPRSAGFRRSFQHAGEALDQGYNVVVFPEGHRTEDGKLHRFRPGIGLLAQESKAQVLPVGLAGLGEMKMGRQKWFRSGKLHVRVGSPITFAPNASAEEITARLESEIARLIK
ncbi:AMP-binding protein [Silvibacterium acidisoli]|uniref:AMP-binding protein n=1 Tax=Acidobacteriaceae bacterium ZG23-2 TaxID=2883246 RepID=UPI00406CD3BE